MWDIALHSSALIAAGERMFSRWRKCGKQNLANESLSRYFAKTGMMKNLTNLYRVFRLFERLLAQNRTNSDPTIR
ncbi:hypothetical protein DQG13_24920 [Paenibacillus sp. YN15]|nr:hypothetical protein DQG13_24920 [Paenibacillus sp. YN15]